MSKYYSKQLLLLSILLLAIAGATIIFFHFRDSREPTTNIQYSFFVAGHVYGSPHGKKIGLHPPFKNKFNIITDNPKIEMGFLTGDIVWTSTVTSWDAVDDELTLLGVPIYFSPGNHDVTNRRLFTNRYGKLGKTYWSFMHKGDLFVMLDPNLSNWNISGDQLLFLRNTLKESTSYRHIFVFFHQLLWWDKNNIFRNVRINSLQGRGKSINFWSEVEPLFHALSNEVYLFAGDVGAFWNHLPMYHHYDNMHFIGSGMGGGVNDNFVIVNVPINKKEIIELDLIWLNSSHRDSQRIEDFRH